MSRAETSSIMLGSVFVLVIVLGVLMPALIYRLNGMIQNTEFEKTYLSRTYAVLMTGLSTLPDGVSVRIEDIPTVIKGPYDISVDTDEIDVREPKEQQGSSTKFFAAGDFNIKTTSAIDTTSGVWFLKQARDITVMKFGRQALFTPAVLACGPLPKFSSIGIDAGHGYADKLSFQGDIGISQGSFKESQYTRALAAEIISLIQGSPWEATRELGSKTFRPGKNFASQDSETPMTIAERVAQLKNQDAVISVHVGEHPNTLIAYVPVGERFEDSAAFACNILNKITQSVHNKENMGVTGAAVIPISMNTLTKDDPATIIDETDSRMILAAGHLSVVLEIGAAADDLTKETNTPDIASAVAKVLGGSDAP